MFPQIRAVAFIFFAGAWCTVLCLVGVALIFIRLFDWTRFTGFWARSLVVLLRWICGIRYEIKGLENIPEVPFIIASKHQSYWETIVMFLVFREPVFILKNEILRVPLFGFLLRRTGVIGIDRKSPTRAIASIRRAMRKSEFRSRPIVIFPEGTRTLPGETRRYQSGVILIYEMLKRPCVPVALNSGEFWPRSGLGFRPGTIRLEFLPPLPRGLERRQFAGMIEERIESASEELNSRTS